MTNRWNLEVDGRYFVDGLDQPLEVYRVWDTGVTRHVDGFTRGGQRRQVNPDDVGDEVGRRRCMADELQDEEGTQRSSCGRFDADLGTRCPRCGAPAKLLRQPRSREERLAGY